MPHLSKYRWINTLVAESASEIPMLPWERGTKHARRMASRQTEKASVLA
ncbi:hypothetical protein LY39_01565 [Roseinatronobacter bogoriensis subsp. barguzinensis]|nr:hypothetical protein [Rhodobaca bogoriensis DSM 18756]TDW38542.1 hypothetical protein LY39_01565 [Rhodobaca barguzinensis]TDY69418.1 hypothetical protein EV660_104303 [Rhodobaca bogoriensis DSM 18756]